MTLVALLAALGAVPDGGIHISGVVLGDDARPAQGQMRLTTVVGMDSNFVGQLEREELSDGGFNFEASGAEEFGLVYRGPRHLRKTFLVRAPAKNLRLSLPKLSRFEVKVLAADGKPRRDAALTVDNRGGKPQAEATYVDHWPANDAGRFVVDEIPLGGATVRAEVEHGCRSTDVAVVVGLSPVVLRFETRPAIWGRVVDANGLGVAHASVDAFPKELDVECEHALTETDADGSFLLVDCPPVLHRLRAYYPMYGAQLTDREVMPGGAPVMIRFGAALDAGSR